MKINLNSSNWLVSSTRENLFITPNGGKDYEYRIILVNMDTGKTYAMQQAVRGSMITSCFGTFYEASRTSADIIINDLVASGEIDLTFWKKVE